MNLSTIRRLHRLVGWCRCASRKSEVDPRLITARAEDKFTVVTPPSNWVNGGSRQVRSAELDARVGDSDQQVWFNSATALAESDRMRGSDSALVQGLDSSKDEANAENRRQVWCRTAYALGRIGRLRSCFGKALDADLPSVRSGAAKALGWIGPAAIETAPRLIAKLNDSDTEVRQQTAEALGQFGTPVVPNLIQALTSPETLSRTGAAIALGLIGAGAKDAGPVLAAVAQRETDADVRANAIQALSKMRYEAAAFVPLLLTALLERQPAVQHAAINALLLLPAPETSVVRLC